MIDFSSARTKMVDCQVRTVDVTDHALIDAMLSVPREEFVAQESQSLAYIDEDISLRPLCDSKSDSDRRLMEGGQLARLLQLANLQKDDMVLDIGCGSGYSAAVMSQLCTSVVAVEEDEALADYASNKLNELGYHSAVVVRGALVEGYASEGPYDVIFIGGAVDKVPDMIFSQLKDGGRLIVVEGVGNSAVAKQYLKDGGNVDGHFAFNCSVEPLPGFQADAAFVF